MDNYVVYHLHDENSLLDSCTNYKLYVDKAKELNQTAICFSNHGNIFNWVEKKMYCEESGIKYLHGVEIYLTETLEEKIRDNFHTILIAKNYDGVKEINSLIDLSTNENHFYYKNRISFNEFLNISGNVISISACLASPLNRLSEDNPYYKKLLQKYDYYEIQPHNIQDQKDYNIKLYELSLQYGKKLIAGTDTHSLDKYKAECRSILQKAKHIEYSNEDYFDLTYKTYNELIDAFEVQNSLTEDVFMEAIYNTNAMADSVDSFELDKSFKYPKIYEDEDEVLKERIKEKYNYKLKNGIITNDEIYLQNIEEELRVFSKIQMNGFMLFMSELTTWCRENDIPFGFCRGSVGGSTVAYILDITDVNPAVWNTVFSRFANEDRLEIGDIDIDISPSQRERVYKYIIDRFGADYTAYILAIGTMAEKGTIDEIGRALNIPLSEVAEIKNEYDSNPEEAKIHYPNLFYYFDGMVGTAISQSIHPAGMIASPISLPDNYGTFWNDGKRILCINMEEVHEISLVKYDILGLKNIEIIKDTCDLAGIKYPLSHEIDWNDINVWQDMITSPIGIFQFEKPYSHSLLAKYNPIKINDISIVNAAIRPSGDSYRNQLINKEKNVNPSEQIDKLLEDNNGYLIFQEDTIKFLKDICGLSGSDADNVRRAIGRKDEDRLNKALPQILDGYCNKSNKSRKESEEEAKAFIQIISDSSNYQFGLNHSTGYSMIGYLCAYFRYHYPLEFTTAYLNNAQNQDDINDGAKLAAIKGIKILPIKFKHSRLNYFIDKDANNIYKGLSSIKGFGEKVDISKELTQFYNKQYSYFTDLLIDIEEYTMIGKSKVDILIKLNYFDIFGGNKKLLNIHEEFTSGKYRYSKKLSQKSKDTRVTELYKIEESMSDEILSIMNQVLIETELLGCPMSTYKFPSGTSYILEVDVKNSPKAKIYGLSTGKIVEVKVYKRDYNKKPFHAGDVVQFRKIQSKQAVSFAGLNEEGRPKFDPIDGKRDLWSMEYTIMKNI